VQGVGVSYPKTKRTTNKALNKTERGLKKAERKLDE
jgi:hypothetical protein